MRNLRWLPALLLPLLIPAVPSPAEKVATTPAPTGYIDDYANVLSAPAKSDLETLAREVHDKTKAQVFVVTIKTLEGESVETFANELFRKWKIGEKKTDRGVLILFAIGDHKDRIEVGYGLEPIINDARAGDIGREMVPDLRASNYDDAVRIGLRDVSQIIADDAKVTLDNLAAPDTDPSPGPAVEEAPQSTKSRLPVTFLIIFMLFSALATVLWLFSRLRARVLQSTGVDLYNANHHSLVSDDSSSDSFSSSSDDDSFSGGDGGDSGGGGSSGSW